MAPYKHRDPTDLKAAATMLVETCGGLTRAITGLRIRSTSQLARYTDPAEPDAHMPVDVVAALEARAGWPAVTAALAAAAGCALLPIEAADDPGSIHSDHAKVAEQLGLQFRLYAEAMANDGTIDRHEAADMLRALDRAAAQIGHLRAHLVLLARGQDDRTQDGRR